MVGIANAGNSIRNSVHEWNFMRGRYLIAYPVLSDTQLSVNPMRMITGAILLLAAVQAFSHAYLIGFPHQAFAGEILVPGSVVLVALGVCFLVWALIVERKH